MTPSRLSPQDKALRAVTEADFQRQVIAIAAAYGWKHYAPPKAGVRRDGSVRAVVAGWPDLALLRDDELIFAELKRQTGKVSPEQLAWLSALDCVPGVTAYIWRPGEIEFIEQRLSPSWRARPIPSVAPQEARP